MAGAEQLTADLADQRDFRQMLGFLAHHSRQEAPQEYSVFTEEPTEEGKEVAGGGASARTSARGADARSANTNRPSSSSSWVSLPQERSTAGLVSSGHFGYMLKKVDKMGTCSGDGTRHFPEVRDGTRHYVQVMPRLLVG